LAKKINITKHLTDRCDVFRNDPVRDKSGHQVSTGSVQIAANLPCRLVNINGKYRPSNPDESKVSILRSALFILPYTFASGDVFDEHKTIRVYGVLYSVVEVTPPDPSIIGAPYELSLERIKT
jgi:hypothetical protein